MSAPKDVEQNLLSLTNYLVSPFKSEKDKIRSIFRWITDNIEYDIHAYLNKSFSAVDPEEVLKKRKCVCEGYARLFKRMTNIAGFESDLVGGNSKGYNYEIGKLFSDKNSHAWNAVKIDGQWRLLDATWGAGYIDKNKRFVRSFNKNKRKIDNRMQWVLVVEECKKAKNKKRYFTEYEICSEVRIPGVLNYGNGVLLCSLLQEKNQKKLYTYTVRVKHIEKEFKFDKHSYSKEGYYFENGLIGELIVLFSVYFQARFYLKATVTGELTSKSMRRRSENEFQYKTPHPFLNFEMFSDQKRNWAYKDGVRVFLDTIRELDQEYHQNFIRAFYWYAEAIREIGIDHQLFFIKMVSRLFPTSSHLSIVSPLSSGTLFQTPKPKSVIFFSTEFMSLLSLASLAHFSNLTFNTHA